MDIFFFHLLYPENRQNQIRAYFDQSIQYVKNLMIFGQSKLIVQNMEILFFTNQVILLERNKGKSSTYIDSSKGF
jgi:hypothetical protein